MDLAYNLHLSKNTFHEERNWVQIRIFKGELYACRTWVLMSTPPAEQASKQGRRGTTKGATAGTGKEECLAAVTVKVNRYENRQGRWAQVLNMSTCRERHGYGTILIAGMEELLKQEETDVVVLYPANNGRAKPFWGSLGFIDRSDSETSFLPPSELVLYEQDGPLMLEKDCSTNQALPRWEKRIQEGAEVKGKDAKKGAKPPKLGRPTTTAKPICGAELKVAADRLQEQRRQFKERQQKQDRLSNSLA
eukprot:TRINITY_DN24550_c0_g1_i1.p1 TRINITY_DN24550_c0_g1~~TRINITY_DN24550_c0_g1_i1.p1  ORF type:complete len:256 (-),score=52.06 TRINITY_DN24550_c0_g1_i1:185-931(-)